MEPTQRSDLPPEFERRLQQAKALSGAARDRALQQLARDFPEHASLSRGLLSDDQSQVVLGSEAGSSVGERLRRLAARGTAGAGRYELHGEVARGGMGAILRAFDQDLGRSLAMKVILGEREGEGGGRVDTQVLERFVEEAQITGQLDHPGVVPVHELGLDEKGRVYFTMRLVKGITAQDVFALARSRAEGWTLTRALEVLLKVCDTLAYAHSKGVVHRDLKPSNVMVGRYGEVYVMDWGLAKVLGQKDAHDLRIRPPHSTSMSRVRTDRSKEHESDPDTALRTMDGAIVGTPCYMPPEQAHGHVDDVGVRSDVYAAGAMLYTLLTGAQPYIRPGSKTSPYMVLEWVRSGPPVPVHQLDRAAPVELVAICERAMAREIEARYASMTELADDLRAFLENRVVRAYRTGARAELASWVRRNRGMAFGMLTAALALVVGGAWALVYAGQATQAEHDAKQALMTAESEKGRADEARKDAVQALQDYREEQRKKAELEDKIRRDRVAGVVLQNQLDASRREDARVVVREMLDIERLKAIDLLLETIAGGSAETLTMLADDRAEAGFAQLLRQASQWEEPSWKKFVRGCLLLARGPESALAELKAAVSEGSDSAALDMAVNRMIAVAHLQAGNPTEALAAHRTAAKIGTSRSLTLIESLSSEKHLLVLRKERENAREAASLLLAGADARVSASELARAAESWPARYPWKEPELVMKAALSLAAGDCLSVTQDRTLWVIAPELWAYGKRRLGQPGVAIRGLSEHGNEADPLSLRTAMVVEEARAWLAMHRPHRALSVLDAHLEKYRAGSVFLPEFRPLHELRAHSLELLGRLEVGLETARTAAVRAAADERIEVLLQQASTVLDGADKAAAAKALDTLENVLPLVDDRWLLARARVQLAVGFAALDRRRAALPQLDRAARSLQEWLLDYGRFHGEPLGAVQVDVLQALGRSAIGVLVDLASDLQAEDMAAAWQVVETFRSPVDLAIGTRPDSLNAPGPDATAYETARANWLNRQLQAEAPKVGTRQNRSGGARVNSETLRQLEERLRSRSPAYMGAVLPRIPSLSDTRSALPEGTALVVFATSGARGVAFVLTRGGVSLVPLTLPAGLRGAAPASPESWGTALVAPVLACGALADRSAPRRLLIAPVDDLCSVPFEFCAVAAAGDQAAQRRLLLEQCEVAYIPSGTAWFDQRLQQQGARRRAAKTGVALVVTDEADGRWMSTLVPSLAGERDERVLAGSDAVFETLRQESVSWRAIGFSLSFDMPPGERPPAAFVAAGPRGRRVTRQDLRDLGITADLAIVAIDRAPGGHVSESGVLAGFARGLWSGGAEAVIAMHASCPRDHAGNLVAAVATAQRNGNDAITAWCEAARQMLGRGVPIASLCGLRLWSVNP